MSEGFRSLPDPDGLLFDLDGTLVDTVPTRVRGWLRVFEEEGVPATWAQVAPLMGADGHWVARQVLQAAGRASDPEDEERIDHRAGQLYDALNQAPRPLPGASLLLGALGRSRLPWAIATSSRAENAVVSVAALLLGVPPQVVDGSHVRHAKPAPDLLLLGADRLRVPPAGVWYIGDAVWDMLAARNAGMVAIGVTTGAVTDEDLAAAGANVVLPRLEPLADELVRRGLIERVGQPLPSRTGREGGAA